MQHGPAASSGSNPKAPGSAGGYLLSAIDKSVTNGNRRVASEDLLQHRRQLAAPMDDALWRLPRECGAQEF